MESGGSALGVGGNVDAVQQGNLELATTAEAGFQDAKAGDFHLTSDSAARDVGELVSGFSSEKDRDGVTRDSKPDVGAYEYSDAPPPDGGTPIGTGGGGNAPGSGGSGNSGNSGNTSAPANADDAGGCGCRNVSSAPATPLGFGFCGLLLTIWLRRRRA